MVQNIKKTEHFRSVFFYVISATMNTKKGMAYTDNDRTFKRGRTHDIF